MNEPKDLLNELKYMARKLDDLSGTYLDLRLMKQSIETCMKLVRMLES